MRVVALLLALVLLSGCGPQSQEMGNTAVAGVLGAEPARRGMTLWAAAEGRAGSKPTFYQGEGRTPAGALEDLSASGQQVVTCAHVEHILLPQSAPELVEPLLSYAFQAPRQSTESQLWVVRTDGLDTVFSEQTDPVRRMSVLKDFGTSGQGFRPLKLREAASALAAGAPDLIPALDLTEEGLDFGGFALYQEGKFTAWLTGETALGAALLMDQPIHWTDSVGDRGVILESTGCRVEPIWQGETLTGLSLTCRLEGTPVGGWQEEPGDVARLEASTARAISQAFAILRRADGDGVGLKGRAGLSSPLRWNALSRDWAEGFDRLTSEVTVHLTLAQPY